MLPDLNDFDLRARIYKRYLHFGSLRFKDQLLDLLARSGTSVFTRGDIALRKIMVDEDNKFISALDWEFAGWYLDY
jgi:hypothetical protein